MKKILFVDRDGTLIHEPEDYQVDSLEKLEFLPGVFAALRRLSNEYEIVMVTNQDGLGTDSFPEDKFWPAQNFIIKTFKNEGIVFRDILIDRTFEEENAPTRKPRTGLVEDLIKDESIDIANSWMIGDRPTDIEFADNIGCQSVFIANKEFEATTKPTFIASSWDEMAELLRRPDRTSKVERKTNETDIRLSLNLDGTGANEIITGVRFFDHMLEQFSKHSGIDLNLSVVGDLDVDKHHTIEDTAIVLGDALKEALGDKKGVTRYGFLLPMDDCLVQTAVDFGGRNWCVWEAEFKREKIGEMPTEMFFHFFKSLSDHAQCNINIKAEGTNEHHKIEAIFKSFAKSVKQAIRREGDSLPTTKGIL